jgi:hypothetical protein
MAGQMVIYQLHHPIVITIHKRCIISGQLLDLFIIFNFIVPESKQFEPDKG